ncbi:hypothetical protein ISN45_Aa03g028350 [Arabidopsis thaliana x Arabidopsis arenosa]|uniref:Uncharacterized protein n=1 Tax=Arabidopsis thaliana x Arabidopsis arenosa TaxID=1240361 RepID=A0A8T2B3Q5_9BRAS|nr:hypothetical protein ISN45_Aa03g028350 [Arabidopsis thaliana x Arabidopsis arenosa]
MGISGFLPTSQVSSKTVPPLGISPLGISTEAESMTSSCSSSTSSTSPTSSTSSSTSSTSSISSTSSSSSSMHCGGSRNEASGSAYQRAQGHLKAMTKTQDKQYYHPKIQTHSRKLMTKTSVLYTNLKTDTLEQMVSPSIVVVSSYSSTETKTTTPKKRSIF